MFNYLTSFEMLAKINEKNRSEAVIIVWLTPKKTEAIIKSLKRYLGAK